jgi:TetR/AcrR family transcriptional regulator, cholesterol catabolism regulator
MAGTARRNHRDFQGKLRHILRHAARVFADKGYEGASIRDISRASGVSLAGLYYYCESKQKLLYLIELETFGSILARLRARLAGAREPEQRLGILVRNHLEYFLSHPVEMKVLAREDETLEGRYAREVAEIKREYYQTARAIFDELRRSGRARRVHPRVAVLSLFGMMNWIYTWHKARLDPGADALADDIAGIFLAGVTNGHRRSLERPGALGGRPRTRLEAAG